MYLDFKIALLYLSAIFIACYFYVYHEKRTIYSKGFQKGYEAGWYDQFREKDTSLYCGQFWLHQKELMEKNFKKYGIEELNRQW